MQAFLIECVLHVSACSTWRHIMLSDREREREGEYACVVVLLNAIVISQSMPIKIAINLVMVNAFLCLLLPLSLPPSHLPL